MSMKVRKLLLRFFGDFIKWAHELSWLHSLEGEERSFCCDDFNWPYFDRTHVRLSEFVSISLT